MPAPKPPAGAESRPSRRRPERPPSEGGHDWRPLPAGTAFLWRCALCAAQCRSRATRRRERCRAHMLAATHWHAGMEPL
eukprot:10842452-Lingulodinium_polyedra.AAC.1